MAVHGRPVPLAGQVVGIMLSLAAITVLTFFSTQRYLAIKSWRLVPPVCWLVFAIYIDSYFFVISATTLQHSVGVNSRYSVCEGAIILCLLFYVTTKLFYLFLMEKAHIIRGTAKRRIHSKLYIFNFVGIFGIYAIVVVLNFVFRLAKMEQGQCIIGMKREVMIPLIVFDAVVNIYLTAMFLVPLTNLHTFQSVCRAEKARLRLRSVARRTFFGTLCTLGASMVNLCILMALNGEPGWICLTCCICDVLFLVLVIQFMTSKDNAGTLGTGSPERSAISVGREPGSQRSIPPAPSTQALRDRIPRHFSAKPLSLIPALISSRRKSGHGESEVDDLGNLYMIDEDALEVPDPCAVVITTTIKRSSQPRNEVLAHAPKATFGFDTNLEAHEEVPGEFAESRILTFATAAFDYREGVRGPLTISTGTKVRAMDEGHGPHRF